MFWCIFMFKGSDRNAHVSGVMDLSANLDTQWKDWQLGGIGGTRKLSGKDLGKPALPFLFFFWLGSFTKGKWQHIHHSDGFFCISERHYMYKWQALTSQKFENVDRVILYVSCVLRWEATVPYISLSSSHVSSGSRRQMA